MQKKHYKSVELIVLEGEGHGFTPQGNQTAMEHALEFMNMKLTAMSECVTMPVVQIKDKTENKRVFPSQ